MKKIINIERKPIIVDTETAEVKTINRAARGIDEVYIIPENAHIEWTSKFFPEGKVVEADVDKNDIMVTFYNKDLGTDFVIIKSKDWLKALNTAARLDQERKEEWAAKQIEKSKTEIFADSSCENVCRGC